MMGVPSVCFLHFACSRVWRRLQHSARTCLGLAPFNAEMPSLLSEYLKLTCLSTGTKDRDRIATGDRACEVLFKRQTQKPDSIEVIACHIHSSKRTKHPEASKFPTLPRLHAMLSLHLYSHLPYSCTSLFTSLTSSPGLNAGSPM